MKKTNLYLYFFFTLIGLALAVQFGIISYGFSPYGINRSFFAYDNITAFHNDGRIAKTAKISSDDLNYEIYMIGSSRLRDGLSPDTVHEITGKNAFNYGISGLLVKEMALIVDHLLEYQNPKTVIIGLDYFAFNDATKSAEDTMVLKRSLEIEDVIKLYMSSFSLKVTRDMWDYQKQNIKIDCHRNGFCKDERFNATEVALYIKQGLKNMSNKTHPLYNFQSHKESTQAFINMLAKLSHAQVNVIVYHAPAHIDYYDRLKDIGLLKKYRGWKHEINQIILKQGYNVWDFNINSPATTLDYESSARYFNDDIHYTKYFGDIILKTMLESDKKNEYLHYSKELTDGNLHHE